MKFINYPVALLLIAVVFLPSICFYPVSGSTATTGTSAQDTPYFGVTFGGNTTAEAKILIDKVKDYTNLFVIANWDVAMNESALTEICQYAYDANLYFMVYFSFVFFNGSQLNPNWLNLFKEAGVEPFHYDWLSSANDRWEDKFLGAYVLDEPGGKQIDVGNYNGFKTTFSGANQTTFVNASGYSDAANRFVRGLSRYYVQRLNNASYPNSIPNSTGRVIPVFTADNALYWFDYLAGYNAVFGELGWTNNEVQHIALCRGAADVQNKQWGAMIAWASNDPPYLATGDKMFQQLNLAYSAGAQYLIVFNYPQINPYGALEDQHFQALQKFWNQIHNSPRTTIKTGEVALVLPKDYGWGMRQPSDNIWGLWQVDALAPQIGAKIATLIKQYGTNLDIIYDDPRFNYTEKYSTIYYWNGTTYSSNKSFLNLSAPIILYPTLAIAAIALTSVPSYFVIKNKKRRPPTQPPSQVTIQAPSSSKAISTNLGNGRLEFVDGTIKFQSEKGRFRNRKAVIRNISVNDVESIKQVGKELTVNWNGATDVFVIEESVLAEKISEKATECLDEQKRILQNKELVQSEVAKTLGIAMEIVDSLFDVLRSLQKRIDWKQLERHTKHAQETGKKFANQTFESPDLDFSKLLVAVEKNLPKETSKETYGLLKALYEYFIVLASKNDLSEDIHPNYKEAKTTILAYYTLNDIILSITVGEEDNQKEITQLVALLESLPSAADLKINISELEAVINKLGIEKEKKGFIKESRMVFKQLVRHKQLKS